jgi:hypothetical protein
MDNRQYIRGNGAAALKKRFSVVKIIGKLMMYSILPVFYVILQSQVKLVSRELERGEYAKQILTEELERLYSDYDKMIPYSEIKDYAAEKLAMKHTPKKVMCFSVLDKSGIIRSNERQELPQLFDTRINLALVNSEQLKTEQ